MTSRICLRLTENPPKVLRGFGDPGSLQPGVAVIGARKATPYGIRCARLFAGWAAAAGYVVISGAAVGCDTAAHRRGARSRRADRRRSGLRRRRRLPTGAQVPSWRASQNRGLSSRNSIGGTRLRSGRFGRATESSPVWPRRSWWSRPDLASGTFITADYALDAGRDVMVVPGSIFAPECRGLQPAPQPGRDSGERRQRAARGARGSRCGPPARGHRWPRCSRRRQTIRCSRPCAPTRRGPTTWRGTWGWTSSKSHGVSVPSRRTELVTKYRDGRYGPC